MHRLSRYYIPTLKESPAEAEVVSHKLLLRAGMIRQVTSGVYNYLPMGWRVLTKIANIVRQEMDRAGSLEIAMPMVQPADLWRESGRWDDYGKELLRIKDRHDRESVLGPTHEEVITDLVRDEVRSYRQLPLNLYQIQTKFRDEIRPRFGLMRGREFIMKDAYSFDRDEDGASASYQAMYEAYRVIFARLGLRFAPVEADSGAIGGSYSHEFMVLAETGEDTIAACESCAYGANVEKAVAVCSLPECTEACPPLQKVATPAAHTVEEVAIMLDVPPSRVIKTLLYEADGKPVAALVRGDRELNEIKLKNHLDVTDLKMASADQVKAWTRAEVGFAGPVGLGVKIYADYELCTATGFVAGGNETDVHLKNVHLQRDCEIEEFADLRSVALGDVCPECATALTLSKGIEVGHVFKLGTKYSAAMDATFLDEEGKEKTLVMGSYGIGVSRIAAACIEQNHDEGGIVWPPPIAPFEVVVLSLAGKDQSLNEKAAEIAGIIERLGVDAILDDRAERPGVKFKDADLVGYPMQVVVGGKGLERGVVEVKNRKTGEKSELPLDGFEAAFAQWRTSVHEDWRLSG